MALDRTWYNALVDDDGSNTVGTVWGKDDIKNLLDSIDAILTAHCLVRLSVAVNVANATWSAVPFDIVDADPSGLWVGGGQVRVKAAGTYGVIANVQWAGGAGGTTRYMQLTVNGALTPATPTSVLPSAAPLFMKVTEVVKVAANANIGILAWHDAGGVLGLGADSRLHVWRIA
jgi:hypothetical protein